MPASLPSEIGGTFTNSQKVIQEFGNVLKSGIQSTSLEQLKGILSEFGIDAPVMPHEILMEVISLLPEGKDHGKLLMRPTKEDNNKRHYQHGCDAITRRFAEDFNNAFGN